MERAFKFFRSAAVSLLTNPTLNQDYIEKALLRGADFTADKLTDKLLNAYESVIESSR